MNIKFKNPKIKITSDGLVLQIPIKKGIDFKPDKDYTADIKEYRQKRSLDANAYCWLLIGKIADVLRTDKDSMYFAMLKAYGQGGAASIQDKDVDNFKRAWQYHESIGTSELNGKHFEHFRFWVGSHLYDTREMSILIGGIVSECKALEIDTATLEELARIKSRWGE